MPVVPPIPRKRRRSRRKAISSRSRRKSWIQRVARFPTVVGLGGLEVGIAERGETSVLRSEIRQSANTPHDPVPDQGEGVPVQKQVGVVGDEGARRSEVDDPARRRRDIAEEVNVRHDIVAEAAFVPGGPLEIDVVERSLHLSERFPGDGQAELLLGPGERQPESAPVSGAPPAGENPPHLLRSVALRERMEVSVAGRGGHVISTGSDGPPSHAPSRSGFGPFPIRRPCAERGRPLRRSSSRYR